MGQIRLLDFKTCKLHRIDLRLFDSSVHRPGMALRPMLFNQGKRNYFLEKCLGQILRGFFTCCKPRKLDRAGLQGIRPSSASAASHPGS